jgi:hypothetical protein
VSSPCDITRLEAADRIWETLSPAERDAVAAAFAEDPDLRVETAAFLAEFRRSGLERVFAEAFARALEPLRGERPVGAVLPALAATARAAHVPHVGASTPPAPQLGGRP